MTNAVTLDLSSLDNLLYTVSPAPLRERGGRMGKSETYRIKGGGGWRDYKVSDEEEG